MELSGNPKATDTGLAHFRDCKNLTQLVLGGTKVTDVGLAALASLPSLNELHLADTRVSRRGHEQLKAGLPKCQIEWSESNRSVAENVLALGGTVGIGSLDMLESRPVQVAADLPGDYVQVRRVSLAGVTKPLDPLLPLLSLLTFPQFDRLESIDLSLSHPNLTSLTAENLAELKPLKRLSLAGSGMTDIGIKHLANLTNLESLDLRRTKVTAAAIEELKASLPSARLSGTAAASKAVRSELRCRLH